MLCWISLRRIGDWCAYSQAGEMYALSDGEQQSSYEHNESRRQPDSIVSLPSSVDRSTAVSLLDFRHASNVVTSFNHVQSFATGVTRLVIGLLCIIFNIINICFIDQVGWVVYVTGNGFWAGCMVSELLTTARVSDFQIYSTICAL